MKVLITGVAGFIGSNLAKRLLNEGHSVIGIDNLSYGELENMASFLQHPSFHFIEKDLNDKTILAQLDAEVVYHLASQKIPRYSSSFKTIVENSKLLDHVIEFCERVKARLIYASTSDVYGKNPEVPFSEESNLVMGPTTVKRWAYATSKMHGEHKIQAYHEEKGLQYTIVRFFGSYGENQNRTWWGGPQSVFIAKALDKEPLEIHGDGMQTRTFTYIQDTVEALYLCLIKQEAHNDIFNIASNPTEEVTILDLGKTIYQMIHPNDEPLIEMIPYASFGKYEDVMRRVPDISKIKKKLGFEPKFSLKSGLERTIEWQKNRS